MTLPLCSFSTRPTNVSITDLARFRHVILQRGNDDATIGPLRAAKPQGLVACYIIPEPESSPSFRNPKATSATVPVAPVWTNGIIFSRDQFQKEIHPHDDWFLHGADGRRLAAVNGDSVNYFYDMNPAATGWRDYFWGLVKTQYVERLGWRAFEIDNCCLSLTKVQRDHGGCREYTDDTTFRKAWAGFLARGREILGTDVIIIPNAIEGKHGAIPKDDFLAAGMDGYLDESAVTGWTDYDANLSPANIVRNLKEIDRHVQQGKIAVCSFRGSALFSGRYSYALFCMIVGDTASFRYVPAGKGYSTVALLDEVKLDSGKPRGPFTVSADGLTVSREFEKMVVSVNLKNRTATFEIVAAPTPEPAPDVASLTALVRQLQQQNVDLVQRLDGMQHESAQTREIANQALEEAKKPIVAETVVRRG